MIKPADSARILHKLAEQIDLEIHSLSNGIEETSYLKEDVEDMLICKLVEVAANEVHKDILLDIESVQRWRNRDGQ